MQLGIAPVSTLTVREGADLFKHMIVHHRQDRLSVLVSTCKIFHIAAENISEKLDGIWVDHLNRAATAFKEYTNCYLRMATDMDTLKAVNAAIALSFAVDKTPNLVYFSQHASEVVTACRHNLFLTVFENNVVAKFMETAFLFWLAVDQLTTIPSQQETAAHAVGDAMKAALEAKKGEAGWFLWLMNHKFETNVRTVVTDEELIVENSMNCCLDCPSRGMQELLNRMELNQR